MRVFEEASNSLPAPFEFSFAAVEEPSPQQATRNTTTNNAAINPYPFVIQPFSPKKIHDFGILYL